MDHEELYPKRGISLKNDCDLNGEQLSYHINYRAPMPKSIVELGCR